MPTKCRTCGHQWASAESHFQLGDPLQCPICQRDKVIKLTPMNLLPYTQQAFWKWVNKVWSLIDKTGQRVEIVGNIFLILYFMGAVVIPPAFESPMKALSYPIVFILLLSAGRFQRLAYIATRDLLVAFLIAFTFASILWSASPAVTSDEIKALVRMSAYGIYLALRYRPKELMFLFATTMATSTITSFIFGAALPQGTHIVDGANVWRGIFAHKQYLGITSTLAVPLFIMLGLDNNQHRWRWFALASIATLNLLLTQSKSSLIGLMLGLALVPFSQIVRQNYKARIAVIALIFLALFYMVLLVSFNVETILVDILGKDTDLNGRVPIWQLSFEIFFREPDRLFNGYGYAGFWTSKYGTFVVENSWARTTHGAAAGNRFHAHSGFVDIFLQFGLIGISACFVSIIRTISRTVSLLLASKQTVYLWMLQFMLVTTIFNFVEIPTYLANHPFWSFFIAFSLLTQIEASKPKEPIPETLVYLPPPELSPQSDSPNGQFPLPQSNGCDNGTRQNGVRQKPLTPSRMKTSGKQTNPPVGTT